MKVRGLSKYLIIVGYDETTIKNSFYTPENKGFLSIMIKCLKLVKSGQGHFKK